MASRKPVSPLTRAIAWVLLIAAFSAWLFSERILPGNSRLYDAILDGNAAAVRQVLVTGADPNSTSSPLTLRRTSTRRYMYPPLIYALRRNKPEAALALVEGGANPNARDLDGKTALELATSAHMPEVVRALIARGAVPRAEGQSR
jgi:hypothetical protein